MVHFQTWPPSGQNTLVVLVCVLQIDANSNGDDTAATTLVKHIRETLPTYCTLSLRLESCIMRNLKLFKPRKHPIFRFDFRQKKTSMIKKPRRVTTCKITPIIGRKKVHSRTKLYFLTKRTLLRHLKVRYFEANSIKFTISSKKISKIDEKKNYKNSPRCANELTSSSYSS